MVSLPNLLPDTAEAFNCDKFVVYKTGQSFPAIAIDQALQQNNKIAKANGGDVGLTENTFTLLHCMILGQKYLQ